MIEKQDVEFKREYNDKANKTMLAFLNSAGGTLYLGLSDDGSVYGLEGDIDDVYRKVVNSFRDAITPDPTAFFNVEPEQIKDKWVLKITVERGSSVPYCFKKYGLVPQGVWVRTGSNTVTATREHIRQMIKDNDTGQFISELSLEQNLTFDYSEGIFREKSLEFNDNKKRSLGLIRTDGRYSNLALILSDQNPYTTKVAIFEGLNKTYFKDHKEFTGSVLRQIDEVLGYLHVYNRVRAVFDGAYRIDLPDYPTQAFREAYINALIHRDYYIEGSVLVSMFDDRVDFLSLGGLMPGVTHDLMLEGVSVTRNEKLAQILLRLGIIEAYGTGIPRIYSNYENSTVQPKIPTVSGGFLISLPNRNYKAEQNKESLDHHEKKLFEEFSYNEFSSEDAAKVLNLSVSGAYKLLARMSETQLLSNRKKGRKMYYKFKW